MYISWILIILQHDLIIESKVRTISVEQPRKKYKYKFYFVLESQRKVILVKVGLQKYF